MRSRVTAKCWPTSSSVCSLPFGPRPKRILMTFSSRGVSVFNTSSVISRRLMLMTASAGFCMVLSSMKSPRCESSSSPIGVSSEIGSWAILRTFRTFEAGMSIFLAISSEVGSRPSSCTSARDRLANPPRRVSRELVTAPVLELVDGLHQADVAFLDQVEELQAAVGVFLRDRDYQSQVGFDQLLLGLLRFGVAHHHGLHGAFDLD